MKSMIVCLFASFALLFFPLLANNGGARTVVTSHGQAVEAHGGGFSEKSCGPGEMISYTGSGTVCVPAPKDGHGYKGEPRPALDSSFSDSTFQHNDLSGSPSSSYAGNSNTNANTERSLLRNAEQRSLGEKERTIHRQEATKEAFRSAGSTHFPSHGSSRTVHHSR